MFKRKKILFPGAFKWIIHCELYFQYKVQNNASHNNETFFIRSTVQIYLIIDSFLWLIQ